MGVEQWIVVSQYPQNRHPQYILSPCDCQGHEILSRSLQIPPTRSSKVCPNPSSTGGGCLWPWVKGKNRLVSGAGTHFQLSPSTPPEIELDHPSPGCRSTLDSNGCLCKGSWSRSYTLHDAPRQTPPIWSLQWVGGACHSCICQTFQPLHNSEP